MDAEYEEMEPHRKFDHWLNDLITTERIEAGDLLNMVTGLLTRLRMVFTPQEMGTILVAVSAKVEQALQNGTAVLDPETGEPAITILPEERAAFGMTLDEEVPDTIEGLTDATD